MKTVLCAVVLGACGHTPDAALPDGAPDAAIDAPVEPEVCGTRAGMRGLTHRDVTIDGQKRTYLVYLPEASPKTPLPLVFVFHGYTMSGQAMVDTTDYTTLADTEHVALAFPDGQGGPDSLGAPWNVGSGVCTSYAGSPPNAPGDDFAFIDAMKADIANDQCIDRPHVFATGFSMGGYFSHHVGCHREDFAGVAPHSGGTHDLSECGGPKPIIIFHGSADPVIPAVCDDPDAVPVLGASPSATAWAAHNGCATTTTSRTVEGGTCVSYDGCPAHGQVELCTFPGMGHCWAGGAAGLYGCPGHANATQLAWEFWKQNAF